MFHKIPKKEKKRKNFIETPSILPYCSRPLSKVYATVYHWISSEFRQGWWQSRPSCSAAKKWSILQCNITEPHYLSYNQQSTNMSFAIIKQGILKQDQMIQSGYTLFPEYTYLWHRNKCFANTLMYTNTLDEVWDTQPCRTAFYNGARNKWSFDSTMAFDVFT